jgi:type I restriction enzyme S subunit
VSLRRYGSHRDSGTGWIGELPAHWQIRRLRTLVEVKKRIAGVEGADVLSITQRGIKVRDKNSNDGQLAESYAHYQRVEVGDFAMNHMDLLTGWVDLSEREGVTSPDYRVFSLRAGVDADPHFLLRVLQNAYSQRVFYALGQGASHLGRWRLPTDAFQTFEVPLPPIEEQGTIAAFLDRETTKIDALVEEQRQLIEVVKEKRKVVISHAVTKGLNASAQMKDSGIEWLGEVPSHWTVAPLKRMWTVTDCKHVTAEFVDDGVPLASIREVQGRYVDLSAAKQTTDGYYEQMIEGGRRPLAGDLIFSRNATVGEVAEVADWHPPFAMGQDVCLLRKIHPAASSGFLRAALRSHVVATQLTGIMVGATFKRVNVEDIRNLIVAFPPSREQAEIAADLEVVDVEQKALIREAERAANLLRERRAALISAAVTGKIDVRQPAVAPAELEPA